MKNLLEKLGLRNRKPIIRETTLKDDDLVLLHRTFDSLYLVRDDRVYGIKEKFSEINSSDPKVSLKYYGVCGKRIRKEFKPYRKLRNS